MKKPEELLKELVEGMKKQNYPEMKIRIKKVIEEMVSTSLGEFKDMDKYQRLKDALVIRFMKEYAADVLLEHGV